MEHIDSFDISLYKSELHRLDFAIVYPESITEETDVDTIKARNAFANNRIKQFIDFHIAIKPNVAVVLFSISQFALPGSPVFNLDNTGKALYHIPKKLYRYLEDMVVESPFLVSNSLLIHIIEQQKLHKSVFASLDTFHQENGLIVLGDIA